MRSSLRWGFAVMTAACCDAVPARRRRGGSSSSSAPATNRGAGDRLTHEFTAITEGVPGLAFLRRISCARPT